MVIDEFIDIKVKVLKHIKVKELTGSYSLIDVIRILFRLT
jgi:hypothetical protein